MSLEYLQNQHNGWMGGPPPSPSQGVLAGLAWNAGNQQRQQSLANTCPPAAPQARTAQGPGGYFPTASHVAAPPPYAAAPRRTECFVARPAASSAVRTDVPRYAPQPQPAPTPGVAARVAKGVFKLCLATTALFGLVALVHNSKQDHTTPTPAAANPSASLPDTPALPSEPSPTPDPVIELGPAPIDRPDSGLTEAPTPVIQSGGGVPDVSTPPAPAPYKEPAPSTMATLLSVPNGELHGPGARHQVFGRDCHGELIFAATSLRFVCGKDDSGSFTIERSNVARVDKNGVRILNHTATLKHNEYHFGVDGKRDEQVHELFSQWFEQ
jgi:hypothetical protein